MPNRTNGIVTADRGQLVVGILEQAESTHNWRCCPFLGVCSNSGQVQLSG